MTEEAQIPPEITFTITMMTDGKILVNGPIQNLALCYFLLEEAKDVVKAFNRQPPKVQAVQGGLMNFVRGKRP